MSGRPGGITRPVAALDVGTSKVAALVGVAGMDGVVRPLGVGARLCQGLRRGLVVDPRATDAAIRAAMDMAERQAGAQAGEVAVSLGAGNVMAGVASAQTAVGGAPVTREHLAALLVEGQRRIDVSPRMLLHAQPAFYTLDGGEPVPDPEGMHAGVLGVDILVLAADASPILNLDACVRAAHLGIAKILPSAVAAGMAVLADEERELGVALVEMGAGCTQIAVHGRGVLLGLATIPMGGGDITDAVAAAFATKRAHAERLKTLNGSAVAAPRDNHEQLETVPIADDAGETGRVTRAALNGVIRERLGVLFAAIDAKLGELGFVGSAGRQVVLTGGGAELAGVAEYAAGALGRSVRVGRPRGLDALTGGAPTAALATLVGLARFAALGPDDLWAQAERHARDVRAADQRSPLVRMVGRLRGSF